MFWRECVQRVHTMGFVGESYSSVLPSPSVLICPSCNSCVVVWVELRAWVYMRVVVGVWSGAGLN